MTFAELVRGTVFRLYSDSKIFAKKESTNLYRPGIKSRGTIIFGELIKIEDTNAEVFIVPEDELA